MNGCRSWAVLGLAATIAACGGERKEDPGPPSGLLRKEADDTAAVDPTKLGEDIETVERALAASYSKLASKLGAHAVLTEATTTVLRGQEPLASLPTKTTIERDAEGRFSAILTNDREYGRDVIFDGEYLYLRPRFGKYHKRRPEKDSEPAEIIDVMGSAFFAQYELVGPALAVRTHRRDAIGNRAVVIVELERATKPRPRPPESLVQRQWRASISVDEADASLSFDVETGALLAAKLTGAVSYTRDGDNYAMKISVTQTIDRIGEAIDIAIPPPEQSVAAPHTLRELDERNELLEGIAPPARRHQGAGDGASGG